MPPWRSRGTRPDQRALPVYEVLEEEFERLHPKATTRPATARSWAWTFDVANENALAAEILDLRRLAIKLRDRSNPVARMVMENGISTPQLSAERVVARLQSRMLDRIGATEALYQAWINAAPAIIAAQPTADEASVPQGPRPFDELEASILATRTALLGAEAGRQAESPSPPRTSTNAESPEQSQKRLRAMLDDVIKALRDPKTIEVQIKHRFAKAVELDAELWAYLNPPPAGDKPVPKLVRLHVAEHLNAILRWDALWKGEGVRDIELSAFAAGLQKLGPDYERSGEQLNRLILEEAFPAELAQTRDRRLARLYAAVRALGTNGSDDIRAALCLSGGGIRSATFALGILQGLATHGVLGRFGYLSTVSGGGYLGSWLSAWMQHESPDQVITALAHAVDGPSDRQPLSRLQMPLLEPEPSPIRHLREYSNYLAPRAGLVSADTWTLIATYIRNLFLNWLFLVPFLAGVLLLPRLIASVLRSTSPTTDVNHAPGTIVGLVAGLLGIVAVSTVHRFRDPAEGGHHVTRSEFLWWCLLPITAATALLAVWWEWFGMLEPDYRGDGTPPLWIALAAGALVHLLGVGLAGLGDWPVELREWLGEFRWRTTRGIGLALWGVVRPVAQLVGALFIVLGTGALAGGALYVVAGWIAYGSRRLSAAWSGARAHGVGSYELFATFATPAFLAVAMFAAFVYVGLASRSASDLEREWSARYSAWLLIGLVGWFAGFAIVLLGPALFASGVALAIGAGLGSLSGIATLMLGHRGATPSTTDRDRGANARAANGGTAATLRRWGLALAAPAATVAVIVLLAVVGAFSVRGACDFSFLGHCHADATHSGMLGIAMSATPRVVVTVVVALVVVGWLAGRIIHANRFSLHAMYRARLIRAYLGAARPAGERRPDLFTGFDDKDNETIRRFWPSAESDHTARRQQSPSNRTPPIQVVNMALNLVSGENLAWQERKAAPFTVTSLHAGSAFVGYRRTSPREPTTDSDSRLYASDPSSLTLGTAMTISGAAASPNMGYHSSPLVTFLMTMFNARLGWWLGNPGPAGDDTFHLAHPRDSIKPMLHEMFGLTSDRHEYVYLSDGGHFDNLGLYEMVLRRCRFIVVSDAGCDRSFSFSDLGNAIRKVRVDLGVPIDFRFGFPMYGRDAQRERAEAALGRYCAIGTIRYSCVDKAPGAAASAAPGAPEYDVNYDGILVYIKPCFYGRSEPRDVFNYGQSSDAFPHESTTDQFFSESQFESYRALGYHIIDTICTPPDSATRTRVERLFEDDPLDALSYLAQLHVGMQPNDVMRFYEQPRPESPQWPPVYRYAR